VVVKITTREVLPDQPPIKAKDVPVDADHRLLAGATFGQNGMVYIEKTFVENHRVPNHAVPSEFE
jgi:hypothetical protein